MFYEEIRIKQCVSYISLCQLRILYNRKFILMATYLGTNAVIVTRDHCTLSHPVVVSTASVLFLCRLLQLFRCISLLFSLISSSFGDLGRLCFMTVAFTAWLHLDFLSEGIRADQKYLLKHIK